MQSYHSNDKKVELSQNQTTKIICRRKK